MSTEESTKQPTCRGLRRFAHVRGRPAWQCCRLLCVVRKMTSSYFFLKYVFGLSVHADASERVRGVQQYMRKDIKKEARRGGGLETSVSTLPHLHFSLIAGSGLECPASVRWVWEE